MPQDPTVNTNISSEAALSMTPEEIVRHLRLYRVRYDMPDTSAFVRYSPNFQREPDELTVHMDAALERHVNAMETGTFSLPELVNDLVHSYVNVHIFPDREALDFFVSGFDGALMQIGFIGGSFDWGRLWMMRGRSNIGLPVAVFLGQRSAVNGQPAVTLVDHRHHRRGARVYRAVSGAGSHVGEEYFVEPSNGATNA